MNTYRGVIIGESLMDSSLLKHVHIINTKVEKIAADPQTPRIRQWTLHSIAVSKEEARETAKRISEALRADEPWYADFKNDTHHYIIFRGKVFRVERANAREYEAAKKYGISLGIPEHQVVF